MAYWMKLFGGRQNSPTVWIFSAQSTVPPLRSSLYVVDSRLKKVNKVLLHLLLPSALLFWPDQFIDNIFVFSLVAQRNRQNWIVNGHGVAHDTLKVAKMYIVQLYYVNIYISKYVLAFINHFLCMYCFKVDHPILKVEENLFCIL